MSLDGSFGNVEDVGERVSCTIKIIGIFNSLKSCWGFYAGTVLLRFLLLLKWDTVVSWIIWE